MKKIILSGLTLCLISFLSSCGDEGKEKTTDNSKEEKPISEATISDEGNVLKLQNQLFSVPSPVQTAILIKRQNIPFNSDLVSDLSKVDSYLTKNKKAMNLGVLGSDLAYLSNYEDANKSIQYLRKVESLAEMLDIKANIDPSLLKRFNENINNADSLNVLNAEFYKNAERYLKENLQNDVSTLILMGGWIESMYFASSHSDNAFLKARIAEQKSTVLNLKGMFASFEDDQLTEISDEFLVLAKLYKTLNTKYEYVAPITDRTSKTTYIKSKSSASVTDEQLAAIKKSISKIRTLIIS